MGVNQDKVTITQIGNKITVTANKELEEFLSTDPTQADAEHQWVALAIETGADDITKVTYNGKYLTAADVADANSLGLPAGSFVLWIKAEEVAITPKKIVLGGKDFETKELTINVELA